MAEIFGYGVAHKVTGVRLPLGRKVYDSKSAASGQLTAAKKGYDRDVKNGNLHFRDHNPYEFHVVPLVAYVEG